MCSAGADGSSGRVGADGSVLAGAAGAVVYYKASIVTSRNILHKRHYVFHCFSYLMSHNMTYIYIYIR